jgi:hypothetical protein
LLETLGWRRVEIPATAGDYFPAAVFETEFLDAISIQLP